MSFDQLFDEESVFVPAVAIVSTEDQGPQPETLPAENVSLVNTFVMRPRLTEHFPAPSVRDIIQMVLQTKLGNKTYNVNDVAHWVRSIADDIVVKIKDMESPPRFKHVVQVFIGQQLGSGCQCIARCCWDADCDTQVTETYSNTSLFCVCTVFGVFQY